jgi:peptidyl-prolyl cis-trans isomerase A (cyclophilin A)
MRHEIRLLLLSLAGVLAACAVFRRDPAPPVPLPADLTAPDSFDVEMVTTKGTMTVRSYRRWSPRGADRFYTLVRVGFFNDSVAFHRTINKFVAQFGIHGDTAITRAWDGKTFPDDTVRTTNARGTIAFARGGPNTRNTQLFFSTVDNARLDTLNGFGFPPIGKIVSGLAVLDSLNWEYSGTRGGQTFPGPSQDSIRRQGNAYLVRRFPRLDYILSARVLRM